MKMQCFCVKHPTKKAILCVKHIVLLADKQIVKFIKWKKQCIFFCVRNKNMYITFLNKTVANTKE